MCARVPALVGYEHILHFLRSNQNSIALHLLYYGQLEYAHLHLCLCRRALQGNYIKKKQGYSRHECFCLQRKALSYCQVKSSSLTGTGLARLFEICQEWYSPVMLELLPVHRAASPYVAFDDDSSSTPTGPDVSTMYIVADLNPPIVHRQEQTRPIRDEIWTFCPLHFPLRVPLRGVPVPPSSSGGTRKALLAAVPQTQNFTIEAGK